MPVQGRIHLGQYADRMCYWLREHRVLWRTRGGQLDWVRVPEELQVEVIVEYLYPLLRRYWIYSASVEFARRHHLPLPARLYLEHLKQAVLIQLFDDRKLYGRCCEWHNWHLRMRGRTSMEPVINCLSGQAVRLLARLHSGFGHRM